LPKKVTDFPWSSILLAGPKERAEFVYNKRMGYILNYKLLKQFLAGQAKKFGAEILTGISAENLLINNGFVNGVKLKENGQTREIRAKITVDATGGRATLSKKLGLVKTNSKDLVVALEYHMQKINFERTKRIDFYVGSNYIPGGYAWIFPMGSESAKVGLGKFISTKNNSNLLEFLKNFVNNNSQTNQAIQTDLHGGSLLANGGIKNHVFNGFISIGDAAAQINPLAGEGIRHAMYSGLFAAETIDYAFQKKSFDKESLQLYNKRWKKYVGNKWAVSYWLQRFVYNQTFKNDILIDKGLKILAQFSPEDIFEICFNYRFDLLKRYIPLVLKYLPTEASKFLGS